MNFIESNRFANPLILKDWLRGEDLNLWPSGYEPDELPGCSTPRQRLCILHFIRFGGDLLSHTLRCSTISATVLNGRVREGTGCFTCAIATKPNKMQRTPIVRDWEIQILIWLFLNQIKPIGPLVPVNWTCYHAYISGLSTWWSSTALRDTLFWGGLPA